jgi:hypothetical protein
MDLQMIEFCVRLGNPIPCESLDILDKLGQLDYLEVNPRVTMFSSPILSITPKDIIIYFARTRLILLLETEKVEFVPGDMLLCEDPHDTPIIAVPINKQLFELGDSTQFRKYKFY